MFSCTSNVEIETHDHENILPFQYNVDVSNSSDGNLLNLTFTTKDKSIKYIPILFKKDANIEDDFLGDLVFATYDGESTLDYKFKENEENYTVVLKLEVNGHINLREKTYDMAFYIDGDGSVLEKFLNKKHRFGHIPNGLNHHHNPIPE